MRPNALSVSPRTPTRSVSTEQSSRGEECQTSTRDQACVAVETFAPTVRHTTFKLLVARGNVMKRRARQFDVEGAYLKGTSLQRTKSFTLVRPPTSRAAPATTHSTIAAFPSCGGSSCRSTARQTLAEYGIAPPSISLSTSSTSRSRNTTPPCYFFKESGGERVDIAL